MTDHTGIFRELHAAVLPVPDLEPARAFYGDVLGLAEVRHIPGILAVYRTSGPTHVCLFVPQEEGEAPAAGGSFPNFRSDDIEATHAHLTGHGVECGPVQGVPEISWFAFRDPFGNRIDVCEYGEDWLP